ncbi:MAG: DegT/DnrJ/EryC1/StrS family aminotransferase [Anaerolineae bacterium]|nr:DegT/DnrJ/EryC1/StrS family aminotransferase [Anaerolineae bacterium]
MSNWRIPLSDLDYGPEEEEAIVRVLRSRWLSMGPEVQAFEHEFAALVGVKHAVAVANGTAALHLAYLALGLRAGDEIIQPAINFVAAANMTLAIRAVPVFADILSLDEPTIDPQELERLITPRTKAVVVMHYGGYVCRMAEIEAICRQHGLAIVEDACHAVGAQYLDGQEHPLHGRKAGNLGDVACFSFFSNKNLATGEGGMVTTNRDDIAEQLRLLRSHGMTTLTWDRHQGHASSYDVLVNGYNYRLDELRAALGRAQLRKLERNNHLRGELVAAYRRHLSDLPGWIVPFADYRGDSAYHLMVVVAPDQEARTRTVSTLKEAGIQTSLHYPCLPDFAVFKGLRGSGVEKSRLFARRAITLPLFPTMSMSQVEEICHLIGSVALS